MTDEPRRITRPRGRPKELGRSREFRVHFNGEKLDEIQAWCEENLITLSAFIRKAVDELFKKVKR